MEIISFGESPFIKIIKETTYIVFWEMKLRDNNGNVYILTTKESTKLELYTGTFIIRNPDEKFEFVNNEEIIITARELFMYKDNLKRLEMMFEDKQRKDEQNTRYVRTYEVNELLNDLVRMNQSNLDKVRSNLIDESLVTGDKELFMRLTSV